MLTSLYRKPSKLYAVTLRRPICTNHPKLSLIPHRPIPHSLWIAPDTRICLITADPPSSNRTAYKDIVQHRLFPEDLKPRIAKVVSFSKLKTKYKSFESRRHLVAEYDIFLADDRIVTLLPNILGKTFYRATAKRPVPVSLTGKAKYHGKGRENTEGGLKRKRDSVGSGSDTIGLPLDVGADIQKALDSTVLHLAPTVTTAIRVAWAGWPVEWIAENVQAAVEATVTRHIPKGWRGLKSLHIKSADSMALPLWLASELWTNEEDVLNQDAPFADGGFNRKKVKTEGGSIAKIKKEAAELGAVGAKGRKVEPERGSLIKVEKVKSEGEPITKIKKRKSEAEEPVNKTKKRKPGEGGSFDADAQAKIKAKKEKTSKKHHDATAAKLEDSMARKEVVELQERTARKEAAARNAIFELPKKKKEKKEEVVSDVATKKGAVVSV